MSCAVGVVLGDVGGTAGSPHKAALEGADGGVRLPVSRRM
jgi:hypothetical protein